MTTKTTDVPLLKLERTFHAKPEKLWAYWTEPLKYAKWLNPAPIDLVIHEFDVRPGGRMKFDMPQPDGSLNPQEGVFHSLTPFTEIVSGTPDKSFLLTVRFHALDETRTSMTVEVKGVPPEWHSPATIGWNQGFDKLERELKANTLFAAGKTYWPAFVSARTFRAPVEKVWKMWTTKEGLEQWYWPEPFVGKVTHIDVRVGGKVEIAADGLGHTSRGTYAEVVPHKRLTMVVPIDIFPDVEAYDRVDIIEFHAQPDGSTKMLFTASRMHTDEWQMLSNEGWGSSLNKLAKALEGKEPPAGGFTIERTFKASPEKVWSMWTTKEGIMKWWALSARDMGYEFQVKHMDVRQGGTFAFEMKGKEHTVVNHGTYNLVIPHWELGWTWHFDIFLAPGEKPYDVPLFLALERLADGGTKMRFTQGPLATPEFSEGSRQGVLANFAKLAQALGE